MEILFLSQKEIKELDMSVDEYILAVENGLQMKAESKIDMPPKMEVLPQNFNFLHAMPCAIESGTYCGIKWISGYFDNPSTNGMPALMGLIILNDAKTGVPLAVMDCIEITKKRTAAVSGIAMRHLANHASEVACVLGCGNQGEANLEVLYNEFPNIQQVKIWDPLEKQAIKLKDIALEEWGKSVVIVSDIQQAMHDCDIVLVAGPGVRDDSLREIKNEWLKRGATVITVNHDANFRRGEITKCADKIFMDDVAMYYWGRRDDLFDGIDEEPQELGDVLIGKVPGRENELETIFSMPIGIAIADLTCAIHIYEKALRDKKGILLPM